MSNKERGLERKGETLSIERKRSRGVFSRFSRFLSGRRFAESYRGRNFNGDSLMAVARYAIRGRSTGKEMAGTASS